ncbi:hypothetical protein GDO78_004847 [Eleutherodactylus coqui]|uniref:Uncharacterized protein n=1 Tax=Eleutherodactylus coqui TaxID=57060 RepID=A0A8J6FKT3_ELECQ|nr:hypothetical protein GDO78_004847 [Eleutherodactylus coqui]
MRLTANCFEEVPNTWSKMSYGEHQAPSLSANVVQDRTCRTQEAQKGYHPMTAQKVLLLHRSRLAEANARCYIQELAICCLYIASCQ